MRKLLGAMLAGTLLLVAPATANAVPDSAVGDFTVTVLEATPEPTPDGDCVIRLTATFSFTGSLEGQFTAPFTILHEGACTAAGDERFLARGTFKGDVTIGSQTRSGKFDFVFEGTIDAAGNARGTLTVLDGTGGLQDLSGAVELRGQAGVGGRYSGTLAF